MKCQLCKQNITGINYGLQSFIVCPTCMNEMIKRRAREKGLFYNQSLEEVQNAIFIIGKQISRIKERKKYEKGQ